MLTHKDHFHGSDLEKIEQIYGIRKEDIVSFQPMSIPWVSHRSCGSIWQNISTVSRPILTGNILPCVSAWQICRHRKKENIIVGNGSTELISLFLYRSSIQRKP